MLVSRSLYSLTLALSALLWLIQPSSLNAAPEQNQKQNQTNIFEAKFRSQVIQFLNSLDEAKQKECLQPMKLKTRWHKQYTGGKREGVQIKSLTDSQKKILKSTLKMVLSDYGWEMAETVAKQDGAQGLDKYYIACFGDPRNQNEPFAFRLCEHHLTIVHLEIKDGNISEFGPILLGANPPVLWEMDESLLMQVWQTQKTQQPISKEQRSQQKPAETVPID